MSAPCSFGKKPGTTIKKKRPGSLVQPGQGIFPTKYVQNYEKIEKAERLAYRR
jgi:hypothetical protein